MAPELDENRGKVILDTIRRLYRRKSRVTLYKLVPKTHPAEDEDILLKSTLQSFIGKTQNRSGYFYRTLCYHIY